MLTNEFRRMSPVVLLVAVLGSLLGYGCSGKIATGSSGTGSTTGSGGSSTTGAVRAPWSHAVHIINRIAFAVRIELRTHDQRKRRVDVFSATATTTPVSPIVRVSKRHGQMRLRAPPSAYEADRMTDHQPAPAADVPKPMPFAIMRNSHEALRASIKVQERHLEAGDVAAFSVEWRTFQKALIVHMAMEDHSMFALLDEVGDGACTKENLPHEHVEDKRLAGAIEAALQGAGDLRAAWKAWQHDHLHHLEHEEKVMMPLTMKTAATPEARARVVHDRLLAPSESIPNFEWYIGWVISMLSQHGSQGQPAPVAVRVFVWGLQHACTPAQWTRYRTLAKSQCAPAIWAEIAPKFNLDADGPL